jgi:tripartite-type tricarboxylate transporter receptor subunit TctC
MKTGFKYFGLLAVGAVALAFDAHAESASEYPSRAVRVINPYAAGGGVDVTARITADVLQKAFGQPFTVENRTGGAGNPAAEGVAASPPDGYTLMATPPQLLTIQDILFKKLPYDPSAFEPVAIVAISPNVLLVRQDHPAKTLPELIAHIKANPGKVIYASQGNGSTTHLTTALFEHRIGTKLVHVPYRGTAPAMNDLAGGHVDMMFVDLGSGLALQSSGRARMLAVAANQRDATIPNVPTVSEGGIPDFQSITWFSYAAPPGTPAPIIAKLNKAVVEGMADPDVQAKYRSLNYTASKATPTEIVAFMKSERKLWGEVIRAANISLD